MQVHRATGLCRKCGAITLLRRSRKVRSSYVYRRRLYDCSNPNCHTTSIYREQFEAFTTKRCPDLESIPAEPARISLRLGLTV